MLALAALPSAAAPAAAKDGEGSDDDGGGKGRGGDDGQDDDRDDGDNRDDDRDDDGDDKDDRKAARDAVRSGEAASLRDILKLIRRRYNGEIVDVKLRRGANLTYRIRMLGNDGKLWSITVDAKSRRILTVSGK